MATYSVGDNPTTWHEVINASIELWSGFWGGGAEVISTFYESAIAN